MLHGRCERVSSMQVNERECVCSCSRIFSSIFWLCSWEGDSCLKIESLLFYSFIRIFLDIGVMRGYASKECAERNEVHKVIDEVRTLDSTQNKLTTEGQQESVSKTKQRPVWYYWYLTYVSGCGLYKQLQRRFIKRRNGEKRGRGDKLRKTNNTYISRRMR